MTEDYIEPSNTNPDTETTYQEILDAPDTYNEVSDPNSPNIIEISNSELQPKTEIKISNYELLTADTDGAEIMHLIDIEETTKILTAISSWFQSNKRKFPSVGIGLYEDIDAPTPTIFDDITFPPELIYLLGQIIESINEDPENLQKPKRKIIMERTGTKHTHPDDFVFHVDTEKVIYDENGRRIGYSDKNGSDKIMVFVERPGSLIVLGRVGNIPNPQANALADHYQLDEVTGDTVVTGIDNPKIVQLDSNKIWKVSVGDLIHAPIPHEDGLLITVSAITEDGVQQRILP